MKWILLFIGFFEAEFEPNHFIIAKQETLTDDSFVFHCKSVIDNFFIGQEVDDFDHDFVFFEAGAQDEMRILFFFFVFDEIVGKDGVLFLDYSVIENVLLYFPVPDHFYGDDWFEEEIGQSKKLDTIKMQFFIKFELIFSELFDIALLLFKFALFDVTCIIFSQSVENTFLLVRTAFIEIVDSWFVDRIAWVRVHSRVFIVLNWSINALV